MSYRALYRKYRPGTLEEITGQEYIVKIIKNSLINDKINHAYMFSGPRGTGKTSIAKILAKSINCSDVKSGEACSKCKSCLAIDDGSCVDIIEIDAASNNGVDEIREIRNKVNLVPTELTYKVYIIDEVHMLTIGAFNALLKTLEEPPKHVVFVLATTDLHKVPLTIISRCQCFEFKRFNETELVSRLKYIVDREKIKISDAILEQIALLAEGGMRDAIGMLEKAVSYSGSEVNESDFESLNGIVSKKDKEEFLAHILKRDAGKVIAFIDKIYASGKDITIFVQDLLILCRDIIIDGYKNRESKHDIDSLLELADYLNTISVSIKNYNSPRILFELKMLSFINKEGTSQIVVSEEEKIVNEEIKETVEKTIEKEEEKIIEESTTEEKKITEEVKESKEKVKEDNEINPIIVNNCISKASKKELTAAKEKWKTLKEYSLDSKYGASACYLTDGTVRAASESELIVTFEYNSMVDRGFKMIIQIEELISKIFDRNYKVALLTADEWEQERSNYINNKDKGLVYEYKDLTDYKRKVDEVKKEVKKDSIVEEAVNLFGEIVTNS